MKLQNLHIYGLTEYQIKNIIWALESVDSSKVNSADLHFMGTLANQMTLTIRNNVNVTIERNSA